METTMVYWVRNGVMKQRMETTTCQRTWRLQKSSLRRLDLFTHFFVQMLWGLYRLYSVIYVIWGMENHMDKKMEDDMEAGMIKAC